EPGRTIWIPPREEHWHGALSTSLMAHIAVQAVDEDDEAAFWMEPVGDEELGRAEAVVAAGSIARRGCLDHPARPGCVFSRTAPVLAGREDRPRGPIPPPGRTGVPCSHLQSEDRMSATVQITFDVRDPRTVSLFWKEVLGYVHPAPPGVELAEGEDPLAAWDAFLERAQVPRELRNSSSALEDPEGIGPRMFFQQVPEGKTVKNRLH